MTVSLVMSWVGSSRPMLSAHLEEAHISYVLAVAKNTRYIDTAGQETVLNDVASRLKHAAWQRLARGITHNVPWPKLAAICSAERLGS